MLARINDIDVHYEEHGSGEPLLFIHGFPLTGALWRPALAKLPDGWHGIAPDLRGFGGTSLGREPVHTMELFADDLVALLDHLGIERAVVCGLSMGGYIAFALWRRARERVRALVLCDTRPAADSDEARHTRLLTATRARTEGTGFLARELLPRLLSPVSARRPDIVARVESMIADTAAEGIARASLGMAERPDSTPWLVTMRVPALVVVGADDAITPVGEVERLADDLPDAHLAVIVDAGHLAPLEQSAVFNHDLELFLERIGAQVSGPRA
ncbi:MAG: alpha/beta fold hydrolase [Longimicrobiales bacterium]